MSNGLDQLMFSLMQARLKAQGSDLEFPPDVRAQTAHLMAEADHKMRSARAAYARVSEIHLANEAKRLPTPEGEQ
ncbi:hypothetical protein [Roseibium album]|uniref:hypothetical protein n=1 Tax=Roseibium album TaxID=311410 RepID=UPI00249028B6|nr:hypothetical protein [Roseibium album]